MLKNRMTVQTVSVKKLCFSTTSETGISIPLFLNPNGYCCFSLHSTLIHVINSAYHNIMERYVFVKNLNHEMTSFLIQLVKVVGAITDHRQRLDSLSTLNVLFYRANELSNFLVTDSSVAITNDSLSDITSSIFIFYQKIYQTELEDTSRWLVDVYSEQKNIDLRYDPRIIHFTRIMRNSYAHFLDYDPPHYVESCGWINCGILCREVVDADPIHPSSSFFRDALSYNFKTTHAEILSKLRSTPVWYTVLLPAIFYYMRLEVIAECDDWEKQV